MSAPVLSRRALLVAGVGLAVAAAAPALQEPQRSQVGMTVRLTDVVLPGGRSGRDLAREAQAYDPGLPVLFTSGYTEDAIIHDGRLDPGVHLLTKPYWIGELAQKVKEVMA